MIKTTWDSLGFLCIKIYYIVLAVKEKAISMAPVSHMWFGNVYAFQMYSV